MAAEREGGGTASFVVRDGGSWWLTPVPVGTPSPCDLDAVLSAVASSVSPVPIGAQPFAAGFAPLPDEVVVAPVWTWVGMVTIGGVVLGVNDGTSLVLDADDLRLLATLDRPVTVVDIVRGTTVADPAARLARLVAAGRVEQHPPGFGLVHQLRDVTATPVDGPARASVPDPVAVAPIAAAPAPDGRVPDGRVPDGRVPDGRVEVYAAWLESVGPALSVGMLLAAARAWGGGALERDFDIRRPATPDEILRALERGSGPAVLLCSNYVWSVDDNLALARAAKALRPELVVIHGGPSTPKYPGDAERFLRAHREVAHVLVRGEGELTLCRLLEALAPDLPSLHRDRLADVAGITFADPATGAIIRTGEPERLADLDALPSPYLAGEFDHIDPSAWRYSVSIETNRGCPYGCTFCDWGSATLSRIRKFGIERVLAEFQWAADRGINGIQLCDANFGIMARDVEITRGLGEIARREGRPNFLSFTPAKNTTKHVAKIFDAAIEAGFLVSTAISLQTIDEGTLEAVERSNISTDSYLALAADLRRRSLPLQGDLLIGLPGQTYESYRADLQFFFDHQISPRSWSLRALPNAPLNDPAQRRRFAIETDDNAIVTATSTMAPEMRQRMLALRKVQVIADQYGVLSQVARFLQWDHAITATELLDHVMVVTSSTPERFPLLTWLFEYFDLHATAPIGWTAFYDEVGRLVAEDFGLDPRAPDLSTVLRLQAALMPAPGRQFPESMELDHDYARYYRDATESLYTTGRAGTPPQPLRAYSPAVFTVAGDPLHLCAGGLRFDGDSRDEAMLGQFWVGVGSSHELSSSLMRVSPAFRDLDLAAIAAEQRQPAR